jgi:hypothetical protein
MEAKFAQGMIVKYPHDNAPDYVKARINIKVTEFVQWLQESAQGQEWINLDLKESQKGGLYAQLDTWKPGNRDATPAPAKTTSNDGEDAPF